MNNVRIGPLIQTYLKELSIDQTQLANHLGLTPGDLVDLLLQDDVGALHLVRISEALGVDVWRMVSEKIKLPVLMALGPGMENFTMINRPITDRPS